ncbi:MAG: hypothetical protein RsTaC01_0869 [Candidatus Paraimprobicoccus trichonymphae]|uniref:Uncharacterized protein n=1 Tax=Candidatus Paraimprobicoccus trichonymphae TaxID=3033793 RepID=A0AA48I095_9FIRM|nr:MAG: hypothetical protein RsTaC01_0869 [Candidatus Paraimprobicoccus trichonymphae]
MGGSYESKNFYAICLNDYAIKTKDNKVFVREENFNPLDDKNVNVKYLEVMIPHNKIGYFILVEQHDIKLYTHDELENNRYVYVLNGSYELEISELNCAIYLNDNTIETKDGKVFVLEKNFDPLVSKNVKYLEVNNICDKFFILKEQS